MGRGSGARQRPEARHIAKMKREEKGWRELMEKQRGTNGFITCQKIGLAEGARAEVPNAAGGEGGHRAATPDVATHTYSDSRHYQDNQYSCILIEMYR